MRKLIIFLFIVCNFFIVMFSHISAADNLSFSSNNDVGTLNLAPDAKSAVLIEPTTMEVIYEKNSHTQLAPASMTKIMTMLLVMEALEKEVISLDQMLTASKYATTMGGTQIYLEVGEQMSVNDLLKAVAIGSANDAAVVLAEGISGSCDNFVKLMNDRAKELGLKHTNFKNPNGLPEEGHYTCAMDMAIMSAHLVNYHSEILKYTSTYEDYVREDTEKRFWLVNKNKLIKFVEGVDGLKTGWTNDAGYCLTATINKNNMRFIAVCMGNSSPDIRNKEIMQMLNYGTSNYEVISLYKEGDIIKTYQNIDLLPITYHIAINEDINILKKKGEDLKEITIEEKINYQNIDGINNKDIGKISIYYNENLFKEVNLILLEDVKKASYLRVFLEVLREVFLVAR